MKMENTENIASSTRFFAYKLPGNNRGIVTGIRRVPDPRTAGRVFYVHPYDPKSEGESIRATESFDIASLSEIIKAYQSNFETDRLQKSTSREEHKKEVESTIKELGSLNLEKAIVWKRIVVEKELDPSATFLHLCEAYPDAFIYCFNDSRGGVWMGATPELLLASDKERITSMALAGTRPANSSEDWDVKNLEEQGVVSRYIVEKFHGAGFEPEISHTFTKKAGPVEHLCTIISASAANHTDTSLLDFADTLSPTPAVWGLRTYGKDATEREYYSGYCGPLLENGDFQLFVNLRVMKIYPWGVTLISGGGITPKSDPDDEWYETERKAKTLIDKLIFIEESK